VDVIYCQDCGAQNEVGPVDCRICGRSLLRAESETPCPSCGRPLGEDATFCGACGVPAPAPVAAVAAPAEDVFTDASLAAPVDSAPALPIEEPVAVGQAEVLDDAPVVTTDGAEAEAARNPTGLGTDLDLPDWIKRAAAQTPYDPASAVVAQPPAIGVMPGVGSTVPHAQLDAPLAAMVAADAAKPEADRPLPPLPDGGLAATMPAWLRAPLPSPGADATDPGPATNGAPATSPTLRPATPPPATVDARGFISENDLPSWIKQLVAKEEAEEEERRSAAAAEVAAAEASDAVPAAMGTGVRPGLARLPVEPTPVAAASNSWLSRGERPTGLPRRGPGTGNLREDAAASGAGGVLSGERTSTFADVVERHPVSSGTGPLRRQPRDEVVPDPAPRSADAVGTRDAAESPVEESGAKRNRRTLLVAALLAMVVVAVLLYLWSGGYST